MSSAPIIVHSLHPEVSSENFTDAANCWSSASLWVPDRIMSSGWLQHAPFAFWLMQAVRPRTFVELGVYTGFSYLAFCQAVQELGLSTTCYGIDTWKGDEHATYYGPEVLTRLKEDHDGRYAGFSQLIQSTFAAALDYFEDQSVDLLHIDGRHFYEDVRDDFESWQPKLSKSAVVLLHDTNVRKKEFGVWRLWQELASDYPSFEFKHGHGLGVLGVGKEIPVPLRPLFFGSDASSERIRQIYARLGMAVAERLDLSSAREAIALRDGELGMLRSEVKARAEAFLALEAETDRLRANLLATQAPLEKECSALRADIGNKTEEIASLRTQLDSSAKSAAELRAELTRKSGELSSAQVQCGALQSRIGVVEEEFRRKVEEVSNLKTELDARQSRIAVIDAEFARKVDEISLAKAELDARQNRVAVLEEDAAQKARALLSAQAELASRQDRIGVLEAEAFRAKDGLSVVLAELEMLRQANAALQGELSKRNDEADALGSEVKAYRDEISALAEQTSEKAAALSNLRMEIEARDSRIGAVEAELARKVDEVGLLQAQLRDSERQTEQLLETHRKAKARTLAVSLGQVRSRDHQIAMLQAELKAQREQTSKEIVQAEARIVSERERADAELEESAAVTHARENTIEALREELEAQEAARQRLASEIMEFRRELETWHALSKERELRLAETQERLSAIEASTFWNLTSPLRSTVSHARSFGRSVKGLARRASSGEIFRRRPILEALPAPAEAPAVQPPPEPSPTIDIKARVREEKRERLRRFMEGSSRIVLRESDSPIVTVIIVTYNSPELVYGCLSALSQNLTLPAQTIIFDNCSDKETIDLLYRIDGASITLHDENLHFLRAVNLAALPAKGRYLLILNSDAEIAPGAVESAIETLEQIPNAGAVGGRIILPDGKLQEAGCIIWNDGSCAGYGRGGDPEATEFNWRRVVDFCSAVFLVVPRKLFASLGGFDEDFAPAYYEEVDLAVRMRQAGKFVIYDPRAVVIHHEYGSSDSARATDLMRRNQAIFRKRHAGYLMGQLAPDTANLLQARSGGSRARRILYIEDDVPVGSAGSGMPRTREIIRGLVQLGFELTFVALRNWARAKRDAYEYLPLEVEFAELANQSIEEFLEKRRGFFARVFVSRPHNMAALAEVRDRRPDLFEGVELIYDAEAIFARREMMRLAIKGVAAPTIDPDQLLRSELGFAGSADRVITVSPIEQAEFRKAGVARVDVLAHAVDVVRTDKPFRSRQDFLFVGRLEEDDSPNVDSVVWFITEVLPLIDQMMDVAPRVFLVGRASAPRIKALESTRIILVGEVDNVRPWYESCRIFVAPTRFAAGIPLKVCEAGAGGIPVVATDLVFAQLGWGGRPEFRSGTSAEDFAKACVEVYTNETLWNAIRDAELELVEEVFSRAVFDRQLRLIFEAPDTAPENGDWALSIDYVE